MLKKFRHFSKLMFYAFEKELELPHSTEIPIYVFPEKELRGLSPNSYIHVPVSDLYTCIPRIGPHIWLQQNRQTNPGNMYDCVYDLGDRTLYFCFGNNKDAQFHLWENINGNQTFTLDSRRPFIGRAVLYRRWRKIIYFLYLFKMRVAVPGNLS